MEQPLETLVFGFGSILIPETVIALCARHAKPKTWMAVFIIHNNVLGKNQANVRHNWGNWQAAKAYLHSLEISL